MSLLFLPSSLAVASHGYHFEVQNLESPKWSPSHPSFSIVQCNLSRFISENICGISKDRSPRILKFTARSSKDHNNPTINDVSLDWEDVEQEEAEDMGSPWEGAVIYKRNPSISHVEYCTTLERLGLGKLSTKVSRSRASMMGLRVTKAVKAYPHGTPVQISIDVTKKKRKLRLDGILKTVLTLDCRRCGEATAECIYSNFSLLLTEEPVAEPETIDMGVIFGEDKSKPFSANGEEEEEEEEEEDDEASIDWDDRLHFPRKEQEIDISKNLRDLVHVEITMNALCDPGCKGLCLKCGTNLNKSNCNCEKEEANTKGYRPLGDLKKQMQAKK